MSSRSDVTRLLADLRTRKQGAGEELFPLVYEELRSLARHYMSRERADHTLQTTALVHEAYLRLVGDEDVAWESRAHYFRVAARAMRRILIDHARGKCRQKKGGGRKREPLDDAAATIGMSVADLLDLDRALTRLTEKDPPIAEVVELRFFGGLNVEEAARVLDISSRKVKRDWRIAKAWLQKEIGISGMRSG